MSFNGTSGKFSHTPEFAFNDMLYVYYVRRKDTVLMLTLYAKTERNDISPEQIRRIIEEYG